jgi:hypothetical protein
MTDTSARLGLPFLHAGQAQKELWHNEALAMLDLAVQPAVEAVGLDQPPAEPAEGQAWIVGAQPAGAWAGQGDALAGWTGGGWRFVPATEGAAVWVAGAGVPARYTGGAWRVGQRPAVADPAGGATVDAEARAALAAVLAALRAHGLVAS